jgi:hypothetical protein
MFSFLYCLFSLLLFSGLAILIADGYWYIRFRRAAAEAKRYAHGFVISTCPVCGGNLQLTEQAKTRLGIPFVTRTVNCGSCKS